jgi:hypothetical protein
MKKITWTVLPFAKYYPLGWIRGTHEKLKQHSGTDWTMLLEWLLIVYRGVKWVQPVQDEIQWWVFVNGVINLGSEVLTEVVRWEPTYISEAAFLVVYSKLISFSTCSWTLKTEMHDIVRTTQKAEICGKETSGFTEEGNIFTNLHNNYPALFTQYCNQFHDFQNDWVSVLCPPSGILNN